MSLHARHKLLRSFPLGFGIILGCHYFKSSVTGRPGFPRKDCDCGRWTGDAERGRENLERDETGETAPNPAVSGPGNSSRATGSVCIRL